MRLGLLAALTVSVLSTAPCVAGVQATMMVYTHHREIHRPCPRSIETSAYQVRVASAAFTDAFDPRRMRLLSQCDCGNLRGCRCADAIWDSPLQDQQAEEEEEGMDDQGYRQLGY